MRDHPCQALDRLLPTVCRISLFHDFPVSSWKNTHTHMTHTHTHHPVTRHQVRPVGRYRSSHCLHWPQIHWCRDGGGGHRCIGPLGRPRWGWGEDVLGLSQQNLAPGVIALSSFALGTLGRRVAMVDRDMISSSSGRSERPVVHQDAASSG